MTRTVTGVCWPKFWSSSPWNDFRESWKENFAAARRNKHLKWQFVGVSGCIVPSRPAFRTREKRQELASMVEAGEGTTSTGARPRSLFLSLCPSLKANIDEAVAPSIDMKGRQWQQCLLSPGSEGARTPDGCPFMCIASRLAAGLPTSARSFPYIYLLIHVQFTCMYSTYTWDHSSGSRRQVKCAVRCALSPVIGAHHTNL